MVKLVSPNGWKLFFSAEKKMFRETTLYELLRAMVYCCSVQRTCSLESRSRWLNVNKYYWENNLRKQGWLIEGNNFPVY